MAEYSLPPDEKTLWRAWYPYVLTRYESRHTVIPLLRPLALYRPIHYGRKPQSPNLLSLYEPLPCHVIRKKKKKVLVAHSLYLLCAPPVSGTNQISACPLTQLLLPPFSTSLGYVKRGVCIGVALFHLLSTQWFLEQNQCAVQFYFLTVTERTPDTTWERKYRERNTQTKVSVGL